MSSKNKKAIEMYVEADNFRVRQQYFEAIRLLSQAIERDPNFFEAYLRMGYCYKSMKDFEKAEDFFERGLSLAGEMRWKKVFWIELAENNMKRPDYRKVIGFTGQYLENEVISKPRIEQMSLWKASAEFSLQHMRSEIPFVPHQLSDTVNCFPLQYFPVLTADDQQMIFTRRLGVRDEFDEDLVITTRDEDGKWTTPQSISSNINTRFNEGTSTISGDGTQLIFTSCYGMNGNCDLFESRKTGDVWSTPKNVGPQINSAAWESQPALSADGRVLYFVSNRKGGIGRGDIYVSFQHSPGNWTKAQNLGPNINSKAEEYSPFIHANGRTLFFASDGRPGFGGFDIYWSDWSDSTWSAPTNFGYPINNHEDQFSLFITAGGEKGYYSHEEITGKGTSKIFEFSVPEEYRVKYKSTTVKGFVRDKVTDQPLKATVELYNLERNEMISFVNSDSVSGKYLMVLTQGADYALYVNAPGYLFQSLNFNYEEASNLESLNINVFLEKAGKGASIVLKNIFFDLDKFDLDPKSATELDKIARFLRDNPTIRIEISGYTDDQGADAYNLQLSQKRAQSVSAYLIQKGIESKRLTQVGWGSKHPRVPNDSDTNRQVNRRIEFKIIP